MNCGYYRGIKLMCHNMKLYERVHDNRLRNIVSITEEQFGFVKGKSTTDAMFALRPLQERYREWQQDLHCVFIDLQKAYDRVPRKELYWCMRDKGVPEKYIRLEKDMYHQCETVARCAARTSEPFSVEVGLHRRSAFSSFLFAIMIDSLTENIRKKHLGRWYSQMMWCCAQGRKTCWSWNWSSGGKHWKREEWQCQGQRQRRRRRRLFILTGCFLVRRPTFKAYNEAASMQVT